MQLLGIGSTPAAKSLTIPAKGIARVDAATFFGITTTSPGAYVTATGDGDIGGFEFVKSSNGDLLGLNARGAAEQLANLYFPQMAVLGSWKTELGLINYSSSPVIVTISAYKPDGALYGAANLQNNPVTRSLDPGAGLREDVASMFSFSGSTVLDGWIKVESTSAAINGYVSYGKDLSVAAVASAAQGLTRAIFSHIATSQGFFNGVAVLNPGTLSANVRILAIQPNGQVLGSFDKVLPPGERLSKLINELIPQAAGQAGGVIWIKSDQPVYLTELFGTDNTLANVPAQPAPDSYRPDAALLSLKLVPSLAPVQVGGSQAFQVQNGTGSFTWKVNGSSGGNAKVGTIGPDGLYKAPSAVPVPQVLTITAETASQVVGASVDVLKKEVLVTGLGVVQSVAYLASLQKLYAAELAAVSTSQSAAQTTTSNIFEISPASPKRLLTSYSGELVSKMIPFTASDGKEFLLLAGQSSGRVIRFNPATKESKDVATGLNQPAALVIDPARNLLVAEADKISVIPRALLEAGAGTKDDGDLKLRTSTFTERMLAVTLFSASGVSGITVDPCSGNILFSDVKNGAIRVYVRLTGEIKTVASGLNNPGQLLGVSRNGVSCPSSLQVLVVERGIDRISLVVPDDPVPKVWVTAPGTTDIAFLPRGAPFIISEGVLLTEATGQLVSQVSVVQVPDLYKAEPTPLPARDKCLGILFTDVNLEAAVRNELHIDGGTPITCDLARSLNSLDASSRSITSLKGLELFSNLQTLQLEGNSISDITPLAALTNLKFLSLGCVSSIATSVDPHLPRKLCDFPQPAGGLGNLISDITPLSGLSSLKELHFDYNRVSSISALAKLTNLSILEMYSNSAPDLTPLSGLRGLSELEAGRNGIRDITPLASLTSLIGVGLTSNSISDVSPLSGLTRLIGLSLAINSLGDIAPLSKLTALTGLFLNVNSIGDITPLVANPGLGAGDTIGLTSNNLSQRNCADLKTLINRGAKVSFNPLRSGQNLVLDLPLVSQNPFTNITSISPQGTARGQQSVAAVVVGTGDLIKFGNALPLPSTARGEILCDITVSFGTNDITAQPLNLTVAQRSGDFSGGPPVLDPLTQQQFPGNRIPLNRLGPGGVMVLPLTINVGVNTKAGTYTFTVTGPKGDVISSGTVVLNVQ
jgi:internalin A